MADGGIIPNLMVADMPASLGFYRDLLGFEVQFLVAASRDMRPPETDGDCIFASLKWAGAELMLQTATSLAEDLPGTTPSGSFAGTIYLRGYDPEAALRSVPADCVVKGPFRQWYGMRELYLRDPDGHILCLGVPEGPPPT